MLPSSCGRAATSLLIAFAATHLEALPPKQIHHEVYPAIDLATYLSDSGAPEYDWIVRPGGDPAVIRMQFPFTDRVELDRAGNLVIRIGKSEIRHTRPLVYQNIDGRRQSVEGEFILVGEKAASFKVAPYDRSQSLVIDPRIEMGASFGGSGSVDSSPFRAPLYASDAGVSIARDAQGNIYVAGDAASVDFPLVNALPSSGVSCPAPYTTCVVSGVFVAKLDPTGSQLLFSTFVGAPAVSLPPSVLLSALEPQPVRMAVDSTGNAYITGAINALTVKLNPLGQMVWSQSLGNLDGIVGTDLVVEASGKVVIVGTTTSANLPVTPHAYRPASVGQANVFLAELDPGSGAVTYAAYLGPSFNNYIGHPYSPQLAVTPEGAAVIAVTTKSPDWPTSPGVKQPKYASTNADSFDSNVVILKLDTATSELVWATYLGGSRVDTVSGLATGPGGDIYLTGGAGSSDFPFTPGAITSNGNCGQYLTRLNSSGTSLIYSGCAGGNRVAVDSVGNAFVTGVAGRGTFRAIQATPISTTCPVYGSGTPIQSGRIIGYQLCSSGLGGISAINPSGDGVLWSTFLGSGTANGIAVDTSGNVVVTGTGLLLDTHPIAGTNSVSVVRIAPDGEPLGLTLTNAASFVPGIPLPGGLASLFVTGLDDAGGVSILAGGFPAPILSISGVPGGAQQINFQVPFEARGWWIEVQHKGMTTFTSGLPVEVGIFTLQDGSAAVQHAADFSMVTQDHPITSGETIIIYGTGFGGVYPAVATGSGATGPAPLSGTGLGTGSPTIKIGQSVCTNLYTGAAPGFVGGYQINCKVGQDVESGLQDLQVTFDELGLLADFTPPGVSHSNKVRVSVK